MEFVKKLVPTVLIGLAVVITGYILGTSYLSKGKADPKISVTGLGEESFDSDLIVPFILSKLIPFQVPF